MSAERSEIEIRLETMISNIQDPITRESQLDPKFVRERHRKMMLNNHPDRGGSPFLAAKVNEASDLLIKGDQRRR